MYGFHEYPTEVVRGTVDNYVAVSHAGHGINSYAITYQLVYGRLALFAQTLWGGVYNNAAVDGARVADQLARCAKLIEDYEEHAAADLLAPPPARLIVVESAFQSVAVCAWLAQPLRDRDRAAEWLDGATVVGDLPTYAARELLRQPTWATTETPR